MTERIYYTDPYAREFDARVVRVTSLDGRVAVVLDQTAFYPTSGGQPFDTGTLGDAHVSDVIDNEADGIVHVIDRALVEGQSVHGTVDWTRRFDHMQQHTGQHVLSAAFDRRHGARTESFHLGSAASTIDLARIVSADEIASVEDEANRIVWEDRPVAIRFEDAGSVAGLLRKESARTGTLRLIDIDGYDVSACGGTHVARTGAIGVIAVSRWEKFRGGTRVEFVCGGRALRAFRTLRDSMSASGKFLSVLPGELPAAVERLQGEVKTAGRTVRDMQARLATYEAQHLVMSHPEHDVIVEVLEGWDQTGLKAIAAAVAGHPGRTIALIGSPAPAQIVIARSADASTDAAAVLRSLIAEFGGKGGGRPELAQGGGLTGDPAAIMAAAKQLLTPNS